MKPDHARHLAAELVRLLASVRLYALHELTREELEAIQNEAGGLVDAAGERLAELHRVVRVTGSDR